MLGNNHLKQCFESKLSEPKEAEMLLNGDEKVHGYRYYSPDAGK